MSFQTPQVTGLKVLDEGVTVVNPAVTMDFTGAGVAATDGGNGKATVTIGGGAAGTNTATEKLTPTTSGDNVTLDLTALAHTFTSVQFITKNGQTMDPADATFGWSRVANTVTVLNAANTDVFLVNYNW